MSENNTLLYLDCSNGISGDMFAGALLDLGADREILLRTLRSLPLDGYSVQISRVMRSALNVCDFDVLLESGDNGKDHDMEYLYGHEHDHSHEHAHCHEHDHSHEHAHCHEHDHSHEHGHNHEHDHGHDHSHGGHIHRSLSDIREILEGGRLSPKALSSALSVFRIVAEAEAHVHGKTVEEVHFHEVGAVDSIVDIAAAGICLDLLGIDRVVIPSLTDGSGTIRCQHGILPVPVPAVAQIAASHSIPMHIAPVRGELVTPTGAAIAAAIRTDDHLPDRFIIRKVGMGAGKRTYPGTPGFMRAMLIEENS